MTNEATNAITPLSINRQTDIEGCEKFVADLRSRSAPVALKLATDWKLDSRPGGVAAGAQTIITWARSQNEALLVTHSQPRDRAVTLDNLCRRFHGIVAAMMAARIVEVDAKTDVTKIVHELIRAHVSGMNKLKFEGLARGHALPLFCIDHSSLRYLRPFYHQSDHPDVRSAGDFVDLFKRLAPQAAPVGEGGLQPIAEDLGLVLHELFSNTHVHARTDVSERTYRRSVRGVILAERSVLGGRIDELGPGDADLERYLHSLQRSFSSRASFKVFEISLFDSGPGMAARRMGNSIPESMNIEAEAEVVRSCFLKASSSRERAGYGYGLPRVLAVLKKRGGYLGLRTGRVALSRHFDLETAAQAGPVSDGDARLLDAETGGTGATTRQRMEGTAVTILIPLVAR